MTRAPRIRVQAWLVFAALAALVLACGCGSSTTTTTTISTPATATTHASTSPSAKIGVVTTPKFAKPPASAPVRSGVVAITYQNIAIAPDVVKVKTGSTVKWTNKDTIKHNVTSVSGPQHIASKPFGQGATFEVKVSKPGVIHYVDTNFPTTMNGTIEVVG